MRSAVHVAPSAYLSSVAASADLVSAILPDSCNADLFPHTDAALEKWSGGHSDDPPTGEGAKEEPGCSQLWTKILVLGCRPFQSLLWACAWMTAPYVLLWVYVWGSLYAPPTFASIVGRRFQHMALTVSAAVTVRADIPDMELSTTSSTTRSPQLEYHLGWNHLVCLAPMARGGTRVGCHLSRHLCPVTQTSLHHHRWMCGRAGREEEG